MGSSRWMRLVLGLTVAALLCAPAWSANPLARKPPTITVSLDATDAPRKILHARLVIPASPGALTLYYPKWLPGEHGPTGPIVNLAGLKLSAGGREISWRRDLEDMYTFHCQVPERASAVEVSLDFLMPDMASGFSSGASATSELAVINWNQVVLYPSGWPAAELTYVASLQLPPGWKFGTALPVAKQESYAVEFQPVSLVRLIDSPVLAGAHFREVALSPGQDPPHFLDIAADADADLAMSPQVEAAYRQLVAETGALFGARHYRDYHFLYTLSEYTAHFGLEHHESSDDRTFERVFLDNDRFKTSAGLLPHEFVHSWNGKFRRPAGLATSDYQQPMKGELLWVYEGLTQYLGNMLTARSGLYTAEEYRDHLAQVAAALDHTPGRSWRNLQDTADAAQVLFGSPAAWESWRRSVDFYDESVLIWLDVDTTIRRESHGQKSLDDFCHLFHGAPSTGPEMKKYSFDDVANELNRVVPYDWKRFLRERLESHGPGAPLGGLEASGWRLVYTDQMSPLQRSAESVRHQTDVSFSLGFWVNHEGVLGDVIPGMPAAQAGMAPGLRLLAVNGRQYSPEVLREAIRAAKGGSQPIELLAFNDGYYKSYRLDYHEGEKYPHLVRDESKPDLLSDIIKAHAAPAAGGAAQ
jgi:predicted metalloprotease with PDZ domain